MFKMLPTPNFSMACIYILVSVILVLQYRFSDFHLILIFYLNFIKINNIVEELFSSFHKGFQPLQVHGCYNLSLFQ